MPSPSSPTPRPLVPELRAHRYDDREWDHGIKKMFCRFFVSGSTRPPDLENGGRGDRAEGHRLSRLGEMSIRLRYFPFHRRVSEPNPVLPLIALANLSAAPLSGGAGSALVLRGARTCVALYAPESLGIGRPGTTSAGTGDGLLPQGAHPKRSSMQDGRPRARVYRQGVCGDPHCVQGR